MRKNSLKLKPLHYEALKLSDVAPDNNEIRKRDMTLLFVEEIKQRVKKGNLINIQVRGEQTSGKSLVGFVLMMFVNSLLKKHNKIWQICPDQFDFLDRVKDMTIENVCMVIDEWNEMSTTGYNSTTNQALLTQFNEVQAQRFIHKIACSPQKVLDATSSIRLDVIDKDKKAKVTTCFVSYVLSRESIVYEQLLGYVEIDVSKGLESKLWEDYRKRKFERMNMLMKKGIMDSREGDDSDIILKVVEEMRDLAIVNGLVQRDIVRSYIKYVQTKFTAISIYGEDKLTGTIFGILTLLKSIYQINQKIANLEKAIRNLDKTRTTESKHLKQQLAIWKESKGKLASAFEKSINYHEDVVNTLQSFADIGKESVLDIRKGGMK